MTLTEFDVQRVFRQEDDSQLVHYGLDVAQARALPDTTNLEQLREWARASILNFGIKLDTKNYQILLDAVDVFEVVNINERQEYFRFIFSMCLTNSQQTDGTNHRRDATAS